MNLRRELVEEECTRELFGALRELESWLHERGLWRKTACATQRDYVEGPERNEFRRLMATVADGIVDSIYVLIGMGGEMGLDLSEVWRRVHAANLAKVGGPVREDGKSLKPPGWIAPDIESAIFKTP